VFRKLAKLVSLAVVLGVLALPASSQAACEADFCSTLKTNSEGVATLNFSPAFVVIAEGQIGIKLVDCTWEVTALFDDGSPPEHHTYLGSEGLSASHTFPKPGKYRIDIYAENGTHAGTEDPCPSFHFIFDATYPEPPPPEPEVEEPEGEGPGGEGPGGEKQPPAKGGQAGGGQSDPGGEPVQDGPIAILVWRQCKGGVAAKRVSCRKSRRVVRRALAALGRRQGSAKVGGFNCRLRPSSVHPMTCKRGPALIYAPLG
jgi:hypothetical protein